MHRIGVALVQGRLADGSDFRFAGVVKIQISTTIGGRSASNGPRQFYSAWAFRRLNQDETYDSESVHELGRCFCFHSRECSTR